MLRYKFSQQVLKDAVKIQSENMDMTAKVTITNHLIGIIGRLAFIEFLKVNNIAFKDNGYVFYIKNKTYICKSSGCKFSAELLDLVLGSEIIFEDYFNYDNVISIFVNSFYREEAYLDFHRCNTIYIKGFASLKEIKNNYKLSANRQYIRYDQNRLKPLDFINYSIYRNFRRI